MNKRQRGNAERGKQHLPEVKAAVEAHSRALEIMYDDMIGNLSMKLNISEKRVKDLVLLVELSGS